MKKINRVKKAQEFQKIIHNGHKFVNSSFVLYVIEKNEKVSRAGISVSKKLGNAVMRNLYKRQVRMMCQDLIDFKNSPYDYILIVRIGYKQLSFAENKNKLEKLLNKAIIK